METAKVFGLGLLSIIPLALTFFLTRLDNMQLAIAALSVSTILIGGFYTYDVWKNQTFSRVYKIMWTLFLLVLFAPMGIWVYWFQHVFQDWRNSATYSID